MIYTTPSSTFAARVDGLPTGLAGTLGVQILDATGAVITARTVAGIAENPAGSGSYLVRLAAPATAGQYSIFWDEGSIGPSTTTSEALVVTYTPPIPAGSGSDLCTLADVKAAMEVTDTSYDALIPSLITAASRAIVDAAAREFAPASPGVTRRFRVSNAFVDVSPYDLRAASAVVFDPDSQNVTLVAHIDYELSPPGADKDGLYSSIKLSQFLSLLSTKMLAFGFADVAVTGDWGYATVPAAVKQACIVAVRSWLRRDVATYAQLDPQMRTVQPQPGGTYKLPAASIQLIEPYFRYPSGMGF